MSSGVSGMTELELCRDLVARAKGLGADEAEVFYSKTRKLEAMFEKNDLQVPKGDTYEGVGVRVLRSGAGGSAGFKQGFAATNVLTDESLDDTLRAALLMADASPEDPNYWLPEPAATQDVPGIFDDATERITLRDAIERGKALVDAARGFDSRVTVDSASYTVELTQRAVANSKGIALSERKSLVTCQAIAFAIDGDEISSFDVEAASNCALADVDPESLGRKLGEKVVSSLGASTIPSFKGSVIIAPYAVIDLIVYPVEFSCSAQSVLDGRSRWKGMLGHGVMSPRISIIDDPTIPGGAGSTAFDREGVPPHPIAIVEDGTLKNYLYNCYTARKAGTVSNGRAAGGDSAIPEIGTTNLCIQPGERPLSEMIRDCSRGLIVNRFSGNVDPVSGDFSGIVKGGQYIEAGAIVKPVKEVMIAGNIYELLRQVVDVSREFIEVGGVRLPNIQLDGCSITGK